jgi:hypothetical protein
MKDLFKPLSLAALCFLGAWASAAELYTPTRAAKDQGMVLKSWGSGTIAETTEAAFDGTMSIRVSSRNFFQGGLMQFETPVDLSAEFGDRNNLLRLMVNLPSGAGAASGIKTLRLVVGTSDGKKSEAYVSLANIMADARGWRGIGIPLQAIRGFADTNKTVSSIALSADTVGTVYIGEIRTFNDTTPVYGETGVTELNLAIGDEYTFTASGSGGATPLRFMWDFDASDGIDVDSEGQTVKRRFRKAGEYTITLTVQDIYGLKTPHTSTIKVTVNP